jgi:hypothetical protein
MAITIASLLRDLKHFVWVVIFKQRIRVAISGTNGGSSTWVTLQTPVAAERKWLLHEVYFKRSSGTAANYTLRIGEDAANADSDVQYAASAVGTSTNDSIDTPKAITADSNGRIYLKPGWDAGSDNACTGWVELEPVLSELG